jgi:nucleotide-binding universal stress UspA family protein
MLRKDILASAGTVADQEERKVRDLFDAYCERNDLTLVDGPPGPEDRLSLSWREESGKQATVIAVQGRLADLIAVAQPDRERNLGLNTLEAALLETGKPVLLSPPQPVEPEALKDYLASHDIAAGVETEKSKATAVGGALLKIARASGADLLLMGAYGQSRRRELIMGGVTQHIIEHADLPVLLTH